MTLYRRSTWVRLSLMLLILMLAITACDSDDDPNADTVPTLEAASITPPPTQTQIGMALSATPSQTPFQPGLQPTLTPFNLPPAQVINTPLPTWTPLPFVPTATPYPYNVSISYPVDGSLIAGYVTIIGYASHPRFVQYAVEWGPDPNPGNLWYPITSPPVTNIVYPQGALGAWNTTQVSDGVYQIRLHVWLNDGTDIPDVVVRGIRVSNTQPTAAPTNTPTARPNQSPAIGLLPGQTVNAGDTVTVPVTISDPEGDVVSVFAASDNPAVANVQVTGANQISITGSAAGTAMITVTANDNQGGSALAAFVVTVQGQNRPPTVSLIANQTLDLGQAANLPLSVSDPDGDVLTVRAVTDNTANVRVSTPDQNTVRIVGDAAGSANVTVTADDGRGGIASISFQVIVRSANQPPTLDPIQPQALNAGDLFDLSFNAVDPDGDPLTATATSDNEAVVSASVNAPGLINLVANGGGAATVTLSVSDSVNPAVTTTFTVNVTSPNQPPTVDPIQAQTMNVGDTLDVPFNAVDPEGDPLTATAVSDNGTVVSVSVNAPGVITLVANSGGTANITLSVSDNNNSPVSVTFPVNVTSPNQPPTVDPIQAQTMNVGDTLDVPFNAVDPEGDSLTATAASDNEAVVSASVTAQGTITLTANGGGTANITVSVSDNNSAPVSITFAVNVASPNQPPTVDPIQPQTMNVGDTLDVPFNTVDPEGDPLTATATSDDEAVVSASVDTPGVITLTANGAGTVNVTLWVSDGVNPEVTTVFAVTVGASNQPPTVDPLQPQTMNVGDTLDVPFNAVDLEGDTLTATATSDAETIVLASVDTPGVITLTANGAGTANVTLSVSDGVNPEVTTIFAVTVGAPNQPPTVDPLQPLTMNVGDTLDVPFNAVDLEGDPLTATAISDDETVVSAIVNTPGVITLTANGAGTANVTLSVSDGVNPEVTTVFAVTVGAPNQPPTVDPLQPLMMNVSDTLDVPFNALDSEGDPLTATATSDDETVVSAIVNTLGVVTLTANGAGTANVTLSVSDGVNPAVDTVFAVTVGAENALPEVQPVPDQALAVDEEIAVTVTITDADSDPIVLTAISQNPGVATASAVGTDTVMLQGVAEGTAVVELTADDSRGGVVTATFNVNVSSAPAAFDLMAYPVLPEIPQSMAQMLSLTYQGGLGLGNRAGVFSKVGDDPMDSQNFMVPFAASENYQLDTFTSLQSTIDFFAPTPVREAIDPSLNSFNVDSVAAGDDYGIETLTQPAPVEPPCDSSGTVLGCEFNATHPSIALIGFSAPNVTYMDPSQFRAELQTLVVESMSTYGVIPVLATIPAENGYSTEQLAEYNRAIVEVATEAGVPLWNLWRAMQERSITDPYSVAPEGPANFTDPALNFGFNIRNLTALQVLEAVRLAAGIQ